MASDREVLWRDGVAPDRDVLLSTIRDYFGANATESNLSDSGATYTLGAQESRPTIPGYPELSMRAVPGRARWVEVYVTPKFVWVTTRQADDFTSAVADGLAGLLRRYFGKHEVKPDEQSCHGPPG